MNRQEPQSTFHDTGNAGKSGDTQNNDSTRNDRITALRDLAATEPSPATVNAGPTAAGTRSRPPRGRLVSVLLAILALVGGLGTWRGIFPWQHQTVARDTVTINLAANHLYCPSQSAWSPDGKLIAVLGQLDDCSQYEGGVFKPNVVELFDTRGQLVRQLQPDMGIANVPGTATAPIVARYSGMTWSPDGKRLALPFQATRGKDPYSNTDMAAIQNGVALLAANGSATEAITASAFYYGDIWDVQARRAINRNNSNLPVSLGFQWGANGTLEATSASATGAAGNPSGGQSFTIWQPGTLGLDSQKNTLNFTATTIAWSPDGRYLAPNLGFGGELTPGASGIAQHGDGTISLAPRDKGLMAAASRLQSPTDPFATNIPVAWRGDGKLIAALDPNRLIDQIISKGDNSVIPDAHNSVTIYDSATGAKRLTLAADPIANSMQVTDLLLPSQLRWNTTGNKLSMLDTAFDTLTVWNVNAR